MAAANPLRYRGYYFDSETGFYYLQSRYYDPKICRFINADDFASTGQGILGHNMFAYCGNNPVNFCDPLGLRFVGFGFQFEVQVGDISYGGEVVIYTDPLVCGGNDYLVASYTYSGYDLSVGELAHMEEIIEALLTTAVFETGNPDVEAWYSAVTVVLNGAGISGGAFVIDGNDSFTSPESYSGGFEAWSVTIPYKGAKGTAFHAYSSTCNAYGLKVGVAFDGIRTKPSNPFAVAYSRSNYSDPYIWEV